MKRATRIAAIINRIRSALRPGTDAPTQPVVRPTIPTQLPSQLPAVDPQEQARVYLVKVRAKLDKLAEDFNAGSINRAQFQNLYVHYQREIRNVEGLIENAPASGAWMDAVTEGQSVLIRRQHVARAQGYAIYENEFGDAAQHAGAV